MKIVITGGAGFVGSNIALQLKRKYPAYTVVVFDNLVRKGSELNLPDLNEHGIQFIKGDIRNKEELDLLGDFDCMVEASAEPSVLSGLDGSPDYIIGNNLYGAVNCFNACIKNKAKVVFLSTSRVYPIRLIEQANYIEEATRFSFADNQTVKGISSKGISELVSLDAPRSFYGATKLSAELLLKEYSEFYGLKTAITRFGVIAGPRQMGKTDQGVVTLWMAKHYWKGALSYIGYGGTGKQVRDILHVDDVVNLVDIQIHDIEKFNDKVYNAGGGLINALSLQEMTSVCKELTGNKITISSIAESRPADLRIYISDNTRIETETGWKPEKTARQVFEDIFEWMKKSQDVLKPILA